MLSLLLTASTAYAACMTQMVQVPVNTMIKSLSMPPPANESMVVGAVQSLVALNSNATTMSINGSMPLNTTFNINTVYCPAANASAPLEFLIHGIGFDSTYWNFPIMPQNYSYSMLANDMGYSTFAIDRLGTGNSSHPMSSVVQTATHVEIVRQLTMMLRNGSLTNTTHDTIVHVGHSYGSAISNALVAQYPTISDGLVLTGYSAKAPGLSLFFAGSDLQIASQAYPDRFGSGMLKMVNSTSGTTTNVSKNLDNGYLITSNAAADQLLFFDTPYFDEAVLEAAERTKQTVTVAEGLTIGNSMAPKFAGPVYVVTGSDDLPYCAGNCYAVNGTNLTSIPQDVSKLFPMSSKFATYIPLKTGHAVQLHPTAMQTDMQIHKWLAMNGIGMSMNSTMVISGMSSMMSSMSMMSTMTTLLIPAAAGAPVSSAAMTPSMGASSAPAMASSAVTKGSMVATSASASSTMTK